MEELLNLIYEKYDKQITWSVAAGLLKKEAIKKQLPDDVDLFFNNCQGLKIGDFAFLIQEMNGLCCLGGNWATKSVYLHVYGNYDKSLLWGQYVLNSENEIDFVTDDGDIVARKYKPFTEALKELENTNFCLKI